LFLVGEIGESRQAATALLRVRYTLIPRRRGTAVPPCASLSLAGFQPAELDVVHDDNHDE
jgi:hypothetical protein